MKFTIRKGMFETNSSPTHTCIITKNNDEYQGFVDGSLYYYNDKFTADPVIEGYKVSEINKDYEDMSEEDFMEKYGEIFYDYPEEAEEIDYDLYRCYGLISYAVMNSNCEEFVNTRDDIKVLSFVGYDG